MRAATRVALCATTIAASCAVVVPAASAAASLTIGGVLLRGPDGGLGIWGTATCSTPFGTATINATALQLVDGGTGGASGSTTITCSGLPVAWGLEANDGQANSCTRPMPGADCFRSGSLVSVFASLMKDGVVETVRVEALPT